MTGLAALGRLVRRTAAAVVVTVSAFCAPALAQPAFWVVKDADSTIYLLGTVHLLKPDTVWKTDKLLAAMKDAQQLWLELPTTDPQAMAPEMMQLVTKYGLSPGMPLSKDMTPEEMKTLDEAAKLAGLSAAQLNIFRPWFAALTISNAAMMRAGYDPSSGVDSNVEGIFKTRGIKPNGLETAEEQIKVFASMTREDEIAYLRETMKEYNEASTELDKMIAQWSTGDLAGLEEMFVTDIKDDSPELYDALLRNRNANWVVKIEDMLTGKGTIFIAVGAGHLIGPDSVLAMLKARGIGSERMQ